MAEELERLVVSLEASITKYERAMKKALGETDKTARRIESRFTKMSAVTNRAVGRILAPLAAAASLRGAQQLIDASVQIENSLKVAGLEGEELTRVYDRLYISANRNVAPFETLTQLYGRAALVQKELGISTEELLDFTDQVAVALRVSGQSASQSSGALLQLSQALGSGIVRAEEFNSILEGALPIAQAAAAGLDEAGGSVAKLRKLVVDGKVSSEAFFRAFEAGAPILEDKVASAQLTVANGFVRLQNVLIDTGRRFNKHTETSKVLTDALEDTGGAVQGFADWLEVAIPEISKFAGLMSSAADGAEKLADAIPKIPALEQLGFGLAKSPFGQFFGLESTGAREVIDQSFSVIGETPQDQALLDFLVGKAGPEAPTPASPIKRRKSITLADYRLPQTDSTKKSPGEKFSDTLDEQARRTKYLQQETALRRTLNPLINDYDAAVTKLTTQQQLENDAVKAGLALTPERKKAISDLAEGYANATVEAAKLAETQDKAAESMRDWFDSGSTAARGFIDDLIEGKDAAEALGNVFAQLGSKLIDLGLSGLFGSGGKDFGLVGQAFGFADGGIAARGKPQQLKKFAAGGISKTAAIFGEGPMVEAAVPLPDGRRIPVDLRMPKMNGANDNVSVSIPISIDATGADAAGLARLQGQLAQLQAELPTRIRAEVKGRGKKWM